VRVLSATDASTAAATADNAAVDRPTGFKRAVVALPHRHLTDFRCGSHRRVPGRWHREDRPTLSRASWRRTAVGA